jgi:hypothetical protein
VHIQLANVDVLKILNTVYINLIFIFRPNYIATPTIINVCESIILK